ncbi:hypothetical protein TrRE_jg5100, partial [Triparma retinervis]
MFASFLPVFAAIMAVMGEGAPVKSLRGFEWDPQALLNQISFPEISEHSLTLDSVGSLQQQQQQQQQHVTASGASARKLNSPVKVEVKGGDWEDVPTSSYSIPNSRSSHGAAIWHHGDTASMVVSFGYHSPSRGVTVPQTDVWAFNFGTSVWSRIYEGGSSMDRRGGHLSIVHQNKLFIYGGLTFDPTITPSGRWFNSEQDGKSNMWMLPLTDPNPTWLKIQSDPDILTRGEVAGGIWGSK